MPSPKRWRLWSVWARRNAATNTPRYTRTRSASVTLNSTEPDQRDEIADQIARPRISPAGPVERLRQDRPPGGTEHQQAPPPAARRPVRRRGDRSVRSHLRPAPAPRSGRPERGTPPIPLTLRGMQGAPRRQARSSARSFFLLPSVLALLALALFPVFAHAGIPKYEADLRNARSPDVESEDAAKPEATSVSRITRLLTTPTAEGSDCRKRTGGRTGSEEAESENPNRWKRQKKAAELRGGGTTILPDRRRWRKRQQATAAAAEAGRASATARKHGGERRRPAPRPSRKQRRLLAGGADPDRGGRPRGDLDRRRALPPAQVGPRP